MQKRSLLVQVLLDMATGGATLEDLVVDRAGTFDAGVNKGYNPVVVRSGSVNVYGEKGVVTNHSVVITPKGQLSSGWIEDGSVDGAGVGVTAGELVDGTYNVSQAGSADVTNYKNVSVKSGSTTSSVDRTTIDAHTVRFTPKATVSEGWQGSGTVTGESVDVNAGELVSGTYPVTESGEFDVSAYEKISVPSGVVAASATKGIVAGHTVTVTPKASRTAGFINSGETEGLGVNVTASELVSGTLNVSQSGTQDVTNYENISVPSGGHGASATKGAVSNHSISVTPKSTATAGFVNAGTVNGTPIVVSASELVSGTLNVNQSGTQDVTIYENISVPSGGHSASATKGAVSNHSVVVTPRSSATSGFVSAGSVAGTGVTVSADELVSGRLAVTQNGIIDVTNYKEIEVNGIVTKESFGSISGSFVTNRSGTALPPFPNPNNLNPNNYDAFLFIFTATAQIDEYTSLLVNFTKSSAISNLQPGLNSCGGYLINVNANSPSTFRTLVIANTFNGSGEGLGAMWMQGSAYGFEFFAGLTAYVQCESNNIGKAYDYSSELFGIKF